MAYVQPAFMVDHVASGLALSAIVARNASALTDPARRPWVDQRPAPTGSFTATGTNAGLVIDMGTTTLADGTNRCVIPAGHTLTGKLLEIVHATASNLSGGVLGGSLTPSSNGVADIDCSVNIGTGKRYWGLQVADSVNAVAYALGEFWLGIRTALTSSAYVQPGFGSEFTQELAQDDFGGRTATVVLSPARRRFSLEVLNLDPSGADYALLERVMTTGRERPIVYWPPDSVVPGPFIVQVTAATRRQEFRAPQAAIRYGVRLEMVEQLT